MGRYVPHPSVKPAKVPTLELVSLPTRIVLPTIPDKEWMIQDMFYQGVTQRQMAKILGITRGSLRTKIRMLGITINQNVNVEEDGPEGVPYSLSSFG